MNEEKGDTFFSLQENWTIEFSYFRIDVKKHFVIFN